MKIAILTDLHFGEMNDSDIMLNHQSNFFDGLFFPYLEENNIKTIISLGDTFHKRKNINYNTLKRCREFYFDKIIDNDYEYYEIIGNHNLYFKSVNDINSPELLFKDYSNIHIISEPLQRRFDSMDILLMPWINKQNEKECFDVMRTTPCTHMFGHFEISGINLYKGFSFEHGTNINLIRHFEMVLSGHYHIKNENGNFMYIGTPYDLDMGDVGHEKGFYILDTETRGLEFIKNPDKLFYKINYTSSSEVDMEYKDKIVLVIVNDPPDFVKYDTFIKELKEIAHDVKIDERYVLHDEESEGVDIESLGDFTDLTAMYVDSSNISESEKGDLKKVLHTLYSKANEIKMEKSKW